MTWVPAKKNIPNVKVISLAHPIAKEISGLSLPQLVEFGWEQFVLSVTRTRGMQVQVEGISSEKRESFLTRYATSRAQGIDVFIDETTQVLSFVIALNLLPDDERPSFAGNVGAAVADLVMENLGFHRRANAAELKLAEAGGSAATKSRKTPDYVYDPGSRHGFEAGQIVIVEAKGSLSPTEARDASVDRRARSAFREQVEEFIGAQPMGLTVANGFAISFGSVPGSQESRVAIACPQTVRVNPQPASLSAAAVGSVRRIYLSQPQPQQRDRQIQQEYVKQEFQQPIQHRRGGGGGGGGEGEGRREGERAQPSGRIAFANYENLFLTCGAGNAAAFLRSILSGGSEGDLGKAARFQEFLVHHGDPSILSGINGSWRLRHLCSISRSHTQSGCRQSFGPTFDCRSPHRSHRGSDCHAGRRVCIRVPSWVGTWQNVGFNQGRLGLSVGARTRGRIDDIRKQTRVPSS
ncbi:hypothetical protein HAP48_0000410 (plasmid) [Bradyrhizobium septentrionale]|uniref:Uncharacterized protein n=1 Tax=Bradyrhizobium septentrionale TaxID=1404411 RepID=A0A973WA81_9BRAD|nr:hypothetical protein [Bradyrhizobium septentrionale]UGY11944.1 hypothetical protein HAP48_0000410 [Bradyrhizobium septentrionale]UGY30148.1 hypothetical protein HU675_0047815 [Bradyrhizobium septentrionale]